MPGKTIVLTRPTGKYSRSADFSIELERVGFLVRSLGVLEYRARPFIEVSSVVTRFLQSEFDWVVFSSPIAVGVFRDLLEESNATKISSSIQIAVQGPGTAEAVREYFGREPNLTPTKFVAENLATALLKTLCKGDRVLHPGAQNGRDVVERDLRGAGFSFERLATYTSVSCEISSSDHEWLTQCDPLLLVFVFMSPSAVSATVDAFKGLQQDPLARAALVSVGPITSREIRSRGMTVAAEAREHSTRGVIEVLKEFV